MERGGQGTQAEQERGGGGVEPLVGDAEDPAVAYGAQVLPAALRDDALEGHAVARAAPGEDHHVGIGSSDGVRRGLLCGVAKELSAGGLDQLGDPGLRVDERLAPLLAIDDGARSASSAMRRARCCDLLLHFRDQRFCCFRRDARWSR